MAKWIDKPGLSAGQLADGDKVLIGDVSEAVGERDKTATLGALREFLGAGISVPVSQVAHGLSVGDVIRHNGTAYVQAKADTAANAEAVGIVTSVPDADSFTYQAAGHVSGLSGLTPGDLYYLQDDGSLGPAPGTVEKGVLIATSGTSGVLILALPGNAGGDMLKAIYDVNGNGKVDVAERVEETTATDSDSGSTHAFDLNSGTVHQLTLTDDCTVSFANVPSGGFGITLELIQGGSGGHTVTWPASVTWAGGVAPTLSTAASAVDVVALYTPDGGTTWRGALVGLAFS